MGPRKTESMSKRPADDSNGGDSNSGERHKARKQEKCRCQALTKMEVATLARAAGTTVKKLTHPGNCMYVEITNSSEKYCILRVTPTEDGAYEVYFHDKVDSMSASNCHFMLNLQAHSYLPTSWIPVSMHPKTEDTYEIVFPPAKTPYDTPKIDIKFRADFGVMDPETKGVSLTGQPYVDSSSSGSDSPPTDDDASSDSE